MIRTHKRVGSRVCFKYPARGTRNVLRMVCGKVVAKGIGPNGPYLTVQEDSGAHRTFSTKKIVQG